MPVTCLADCYEGGPPRGQEHAIEIKGHPRRSRLEGWERGGSIPGTWAGCEGLAARTMGGGGWGGVGKPIGMALISQTKSPPFQLHLHNLAGTLDSLIVVSGNDFEEVGSKESSLKPDCHLLAASLVHSCSVPSRPSSPGLRDSPPPQPVPPPALTHTEAKGCLQKMPISFRQCLAWNLPRLPTARVPKPVAEGVRGGSGRPGSGLLQPPRVPAAPQSVWGFPGPCAPDTSRSTACFHSIYRLFFQISHP